MEKSNTTGQYDRISKILYTITEMCTWGICIIVILQKDFNTIQSLNAPLATLSFFRKRFLIILVPFAGMTLFDFLTRGFYHL